MKQVKITKRDLLKTPEDFLRKVGAVRGSTSYPSCVQMSHEDLAVLKKNYRRRFRKAKPWLRKRQVDSAVGNCILMYGPATIYGEAIRPGYVLVDDSFIDDDVKKSSEPYTYKVVAVPDTPDTFFKKLLKYCGARG